MFATSNYGPVRKENRYPRVCVGPDWCLIKCQGRAIYVPTWVFGKQEERYRVYHQQPGDDD